MWQTPVTNHWYCVWCVFLKQKSDKTWYIYFKRRAHHPLACINRKYWQMDTRLWGYSMKCSFQGSVWKHELCQLVEMKWHNLLTRSDNFLNPLNIWCHITESLTNCSDACLHFVINVLLELASAGFVPSFSVSHCLTIRWVASLTMTVPKEKHPCVRGQRSSFLMALESLFHILRGRQSRQFAFKAQLSKVTFCRVDLSDSGYLSRCSSQIWNSC